MDQVLPTCIWYGVFLFSVVLHEAAHAWVALRGGDPTAYRGGQVSLNPIPHIKREPLGTVAIPLITFLGIYNYSFMIGWASAPYNPRWAHTYPHRAARMALAGPLANLGLLIVSGVLIAAGLFTEVLTLPTESSPTGFSGVVTGEGVWYMVGFGLSVMVSLNLILVLLNLIPVPPFDGSAVIMLFMKPGLARRYQEKSRSPILMIVAFILVYNFFGYVLFPTYQLLLSVLYLAAP